MKFFKIKLLNLNTDQFWKYFILIDTIFVDVTEHGKKKKKKKKKERKKSQDKKSQDLTP